MSTLQPLPQPYPAPPARRPGPRLLTSFIVIGVGIVIGIVAVVAIVIPLANTLTSQEYPVPDTLTLNLHDARYTVYQYVGTRSFFGSDTSSGVLRIQPSTVIVTAPDGSSVPVAYSTRNETLTRGNRDYEAALEFDAPAKGEYILRFVGTQHTSVVVSRSIEDVLRGVVAWFAVGALGGAVLVAGIVMLIVGMVRRGRAKRMMYAGWGAPPQWGPGPPPQYGPGPAPQWNPGAPPPPQWAPPPQQQWNPPPAQPQPWGQPPPQPPRWPPPDAPPPAPQPPPPAPPAEGPPN